MTPPLNLPAPGRCQAIFVILTISHSHMFLLNSCLDLFAAPYLRRDPFSRSYGVNLPSSLAVIHSSASGFSPHPPVSVYGTGGPCLNATSLFSRAWLPSLSARPEARRTVGFRVTPTAFNAEFRLRAEVSLLGRDIARRAGRGILTACASGSPLGLPLAPGSPGAV